MEITTLFKITEILISVFTLGVLFLGLYTWRLQLKGENKYKLSIEVIRYLQKIINKIYDYRNPLISASEKYDALEKHDKLENTIQPINSKASSAYVYIERWSNIVNEFLVVVSRKVAAYAAS
jgi:hypothetical protein